MVWFVVMVWRYWYYCDGYCDFVDVVGWWNVIF